jgi:hypothetical protein
MPMAKTIELPHSIPQNEFEKPAKVFCGIFFTKYLTQNQQILDSSMFFQSCSDTQECKKCAPSKIFSKYHSKDDDMLTR